ncbi:peptide deformylase [Patescibacteria group bacterium]|nr:peptide deformylase [Patescibacteria group bacterium]
MEQLRIHTYGDPVLRRESQKIKDFDSKTRFFCRSMIDFLSKSKDGVGLAAPQVGFNQQVIVINLSLIGEDQGLSPRGFLCLVNPRIIKKSAQKKKGAEGCLSLPGTSVKVKRAVEVEVKGWSLANNEKITIKARDFLARVLQHEIDHLKGVLIIDYLPFWRRSREIKKLIKRVN